MFYRLNFDGYVGGIMKRCGYTTSDALSFWPVGATAEWVKRGKSKSWKPIEAAALGVSQIAIERVEAGQMPMIDGLTIVSVATEVAEARGARIEVLDHLGIVLLEWMPKAGEKGA